MAAPHKLAACIAHLFSKRGSFVKECDDPGEFANILNTVQQSGLAILHKFAPRAEIRRDHGTSLRVRLQNAFPKSFVGVRWKNCELRSCNELLQRGAGDVSGESDVIQVQVSDLLLQRGTLGAFACDYQINVWKAGHCREQIGKSFLRRKPSEI